jgi:hypothetical protein
MTILTTPGQIRLARMYTLKAMLSLEAKGMSRRGRSAYTIIKEEFSLKGNKQSVLAQFETILANEKEPLLATVIANNSST